MVCVWVCESHLLEVHGPSDPLSCLLRDSCCGCSVALWGYCGRTRPRRIYLAAVVVSQLPAEHEQYTHVIIGPSVVVLGFFLKSLKGRDCEFRGSIKKPHSIHETTQVPQIRPNSGKCVSFWRLKVCFSQCAFVSFYVCSSKWYKCPGYWASQ